MIWEICKNTLFPPSGTLCGCVEMLNEGQRCLETEFGMQRELGGGGRRWGLGLGL